MDDVEKVAEETDIVRRIAAYDSSNGGHSDAAGGSAYDLLRECSDEIITLRAALSALGRWQPIETAPKDGTTIQLARASDIYGWVIGYGNWENMDEAFSGWLSYGYSDPPGNLGLAHPTHWRPLPTPPAKGE